jgi:putative sporulation protein YtxC
VRKVLLKSIVFNKDNEGIINGLKYIQHNFSVKNVKIGIVEQMEKETHFVKVFCDDKDYNDRINVRFNFYLSITLYRIIAKQFLKFKLEAFIRDNYFFLKSSEVEDIKRMCKEAFIYEGKIKDENNVFYINRRNIISKKIAKCLEEYLEINVDGLTTFRTRQFEKYFFSIVDRVIEKYMAEKEYKEFIKLLKYFVEIQESKLDEINIYINKKGEYFIKDNIEFKEIAAIIHENSYSKLRNETSVEDIIISELITIAPKKIIIHGEDNCRNKEFLSTIKSVFDNKVEICNNCDFCKDNNLVLT